MQVLEKWKQFLNSAVCPVNVIKWQLKSVYSKVQLRSMFKKICIHKTCFYLKQLI